MKIYYQVKGERRKALAVKVGEFLSQEARYLGAPTFVYAVGDYQIDKNGVLFGCDNLDLEDYLVGQGFEAVTREYAEPDTYESGLGGLGATPTITEIDEEAKSLSGREVADDYRFSNLTITMKRTDFSEQALENLRKILLGKGPLIKKALGVLDLPFSITNEFVLFSWFSKGVDALSVKAYTHFISALCELAKKQQRISLKEKQVENEKFAFRCFLLRLGFIGPEYKDERKILLSKLTGSSAFKDGGGTNDE